MFATAFPPLFSLTVAHRKITRVGQWCSECCRTMCIMKSYRERRECEVFLRGSRSWSTQQCTSSGTRARIRLHQAPNAGLCPLKSHESAESSPPCGWYTQTRTHGAKGWGHRQTACSAVCVGASSTTALKWHKMDRTAHNPFASISIYSLIDTVTHSYTYLTVFNISVRYQQMYYHILTNEASISSDKKTLLMFVWAWSLFLMHLPITPQASHLLFPCSRCLELSSHQVMEYCENYPGNQTPKPNTDSNCFNKHEPSSLVGGPTPMEDGPFTVYTVFYIMRKHPHKQETTCTQK